VVPGHGVSSLVIINSSAVRGGDTLLIALHYWVWIVLGMAACLLLGFLVGRKREAQRGESKPVISGLEKQAEGPTETNEEMIQTLFGTPKPTFLDKMKQAVTRTRENLSERIDEVMAFTKEIDRSTLDDLEAVLIGADMGTKTTQEILGKLREKADRKQIKDAAELKRLIKEQVIEILNATPARAGKPATGQPEIVMVVGVNGTGKTTTIGKLAHALRSEGKTVLLCAADTFRAAAIEQLEIWGSRTGVEVIKTKPGGDPSAVLYDALSAAKARHTDSVIVDTAGRLHTKTGLMAELEKMKRTAQRIIPGAPHEVLLVMDATTGQNGLQQARQFTESAGVTGIVLTKLDGTAKGGVVVAISRELGLPVRYVGVGEKAGDLLPFSAENFADSLFAA
jgi:fused signal recognition particle receptor